MTSMIPDRELSSEPGAGRFIYHGVQMRRGFSILLVLIFALGPLAAMSPASEDAALPACCRRSGAHHCTMNAGGMAAATGVAAGATPILQLPQQCPYYPHCVTVRNAPVHALTVASLGAPIQRVQPVLRGESRTAPILNPVNPLAGRGPPSIPLA